MIRSKALELKKWLFSKSGKTFIKYAISSAITTALTVLLVFLTYDFMHFKSASVSNFLASAVCILPSYYLNRNWAWGRSGKSDLKKEITPFWAIAIIGLLISTGLASLAARFANDISRSRDIASAFIAGTNLATYAFLWILKFLILNKYLFPHEHRDSSPAINELKEEAVDIA